MKTDVLALLETKNFEELRDDEKALVLKEMSERAYKEQRKIILSVQLLKQEDTDRLKPNPQILVRSKAALSQNNKGIGIFRHKIPTWSAAAIFILFFGFREFYQHNGVGTETPVTTETVRDTVYLEKLITKTVQLPGDTVEKYVYVDRPTIIYQEKDNTSNFSANHVMFENVHFEENQYCQIMSCYEPKKGIPIADDSLLFLSQPRLY